MFFFLPARFRSCSLILGSRSMEVQWLWNQVVEFFGTPLLTAAFVLFCFCPVNETKVLGRARLILLPFQPRRRTDGWGTFLDRL